MISLCRQVVLRPPLKNLVSELFLCFKSGKKIYAQTQFLGLFSCLNPLFYQLSLESFDFWGLCYIHFCLCINAFLNLPRQSFYFELLSNSKEGIKTFLKDLRLPKVKEINYGTNLINCTSYSLMKRYKTSISWQLTAEDTPSSPRNNLVQQNHTYFCPGFGKLSNVLLSLNDREASWPMRDVGTFSSK